MRLAGGNSHLEGRVEFCFNNVWGTVCSEGWGSEDTAVVCTQLGFISQGKVMQIFFTRKFFAWLLIDYCVRTLFQRSLKLCSNCLCFAYYYMHG